MLGSAHVERMIMEVLWTLAQIFRRVYITGKACEEHTACEGKAFEEWESGAHKKAEPMQVRLVISSTGF